MVKVKMLKNLGCFVARKQKLEGGHMAPPPAGNRVKLEKI